nr:unnamed protein product [Callosobruchus chinensis]
MDSQKRGKKRAICDGIFEISDEDMSPEQSESDEPEAKISRTDISTSEVEEESNLQDVKEHERPNGTPLFKVDSGISVDPTDTIEIVDDSFTEVISLESDSVVDQDASLFKDDTNVTVLDTPKAVPEIEEGEVDEPESKSMVEDTSNRIPSISIKFSDESIADLYRFKFLKFLQSFVELETDLDELTITVWRDAQLNPKEWVVVDETVCIPNSSEPLSEIPTAELSPLTDRTPKKKKKKKNKKEKDELAEAFILDTTPAANEQNMHVTKYCRKFEIDVCEKTDSAEEDVKISAQICFNCDGHHAMRDCPEPKNYVKINQKRQQFKAQKQTVRYHLEDDQKFSHLKPGMISDGLRDALGLRKNQIPSYIYQMRLLGYPPGWLEEAKFVYSDLAMFDADGKHVLQDVQKKSQGLDPQKIVDYPGFNMPLDEKIKDEFKYYRVPPYSAQFNKKVMIDYFEKEFSKKQDDFETCDMDLDNTLGDSEKTEDSIPEVLKTPQLKEIAKVDLGIPSPSLSDLEKAKEKLLVELQDSNSSSDKISKKLFDKGEEERQETEIIVEKNSSEPKEVLEKDEDTKGSSQADKETKNKNEDAAAMTAEDAAAVTSEDAAAVTSEEKVKVEVAMSDSSNNDDSRQTMSPIPSTSNLIKTSTFGTPILKSTSPFAQLPNPDNFMVGVSPVINFENLPDSTGKYEQMTDVLQKVRQTMKNLQKGSKT